MPLRICKKCDKREMVRISKSQSEYCEKCQGAISSKKKIDKRRDNGECTNCGKKLEPNRCPHCSETLNEKLTCNECRIKGKKKIISQLNKREVKNNVR